MGDLRTYSRRRKRTPKEKANLVNSLPNSSGEVCADQIVKHRSCEPHSSVDPQANKKRTSIVEDEHRGGGLVLLNLVGNVRRSKRRVNQKNVTEDQNPECHGDQTSEDSARQPRNKKRKCRQKDEETSDPEVVLPSLDRQRSKRRGNCESAVTPQQRKLDTNIFECYFESLWRSYLEEKRSSFVYLDCLWFALYTKASSKANVLKWIKKKHIFSKKYVFVPIVRWDHWSLLIFCHFGRSLQSNSKSCTPCMLLLDSLQKADPKRLEPDIRKFVLDIYQAEERPESEKQIRKIPLKVPKVPQQKNGEECGNFVLYYIKLFIENAPENFSINDGYPYFMKKDWFTTEDYECFCKRLDSSCQ